MGVGLAGDTSSGMTDDLPPYEFTDDEIVDAILVLEADYEVSGGRLRREGHPPRE